jgi:hypothetical protein
LNIHVHDVIKLGLLYSGGIPFQISKGGFNLKNLNKLSDVLQLEEERIPKEVVKYLIQEWMQMYEAFSEGEQIDEFQMIQHCQMVFLESSKDDLTLIGLPSCFSECAVEYVETITIGEIFQMYRTYIMQDNEAGIMLYSIVGTLDDNTECFLAEQSELNKR